MEEAINSIHFRFSEYGRNAREWTRKCALLLPEVEKYEVWRAKGFGSIYEYAAKLAGMNRAAVDDALRILKKIEDKPELVRVAEKKGVNAVRPVATIATSETSGFWAEKAEQMSRHSLETYVREVKRQVDQGDEEFSNMEIGTGPKKQNRPLFSAESKTHFTKPKTTIMMELSPEVADQLQKLKGQGNWDDVMKRLLEEREKEKPAPVRAKSRYIPAKIKEYALSKTNSTCAFPGCTKPYTILHHTKRFALKREHDPDRLVPLCKEHERLVHLGLIENEEKPPQYWKIGKDPDRTHEKYQVDRRVLKYRAGFT